MKQLIAKKEMENQAIRRDANMRLKRVEKKLDILANSVRNLEKVVINHVDESWDMRLSFKRWYNRRMKNHASDVLSDKSTEVGLMAEENEKDEVLETEDDEDW